MATLESQLGKSYSDLTEDELIDWIEKLRSSRQVFLDGAYQTRTTRRKAAAKRKGPEITAEFLEGLDDLDLDL